MRTLLNRLGTADAISWANVFVVVVLQVAGSTISSLVDFTGQFGLFLALRLVSLAALAFVLGFGKLLLLRFARLKPKPGITLVTFIVGLLVGTTVFDSLLVASGLTDAPRLLTRFITAAPGVLTALILTSLLVTYAREFSARNDALASAADELVGTRAQASARIAARKQELIADIRDEISAELLHIIGGDSSKGAARMQTLIDDVVRPISYSLARDIGATAPEPSIVPDSRIAWNVVVRSALRANPFHMLAFSLTMGAIGASFLILTFQLRGLLTVIALILLSGLVTALARLAWRFVPSHVPVWLRAALFTLVAIPVAVVSGWIITTLTGFDFFVPLRLSSWIVITVLAHWTVTLVFTVNQLLQQLTAQLTSTVDELKREVISLNHANRQLQKGIARVLHGPVQQAIASSLVRLRAHPNALEDPKYVDSIQHRIRDALDLLNEPVAARTNLETLFDDLTEMWSDVVNIQVDARDSVLELLAAHPVTAYSVSELVREGCSNAIRHGEARTISITIGLDDSGRTVDLRIENDGRPLKRDAAAGIGTQLLDEVTLGWNRVQVGSHVRLDARVPLTDPDSAQL